MKGKQVVQKLLVGLVLGIIVLLVLAGCAPGHPRFSGDRPPAGFLWGVWHGWIAPFALIGGFFNPGIRIYERNNVGWFYDLGFYLAIIGGFGGLSLVRRRDK